LQDLGYVDGENIDIVHRFEDGDVSRAPALGRELVAFAPNLIISANDATTVALAKLTSTIPIVCPVLGDPVKLGLAESYNHPGRNVTGILQDQDGLTSKQLELLVKLVPRATAVAVLNDPVEPAHQLMVREAETASRSLSVKFVNAAIHVPDEIESAFEALRRDRVDGLVVLRGGPLFLTHIARIIALAMAAGLPAIYGAREFADRGGLMSYGVSTSENFRRAAYFVDQILKGSKGADLPIEFPTKLEFVINLKTAKTLGLDVPMTIQMTADEVIE
jgi:putative tryptophan/tyrosine transport system substrate-binding protein